MAYINDQRICDFIMINQYYYTVSELAEELNISDSSVSSLCKSLGATPITIRERALEFVLKNKHLTQDELAQKMCVTKEAIHSYAKELGIELTTKFQKTMQIRKERISQQPKKRTPQKTVYTQTGSDITDQLRGTATSKRVEVRAQDAFFK